MTSRTNKPARIPQVSKFLAVFFSASRIKVSIIFTGCQMNERFYRLLNKVRFFSILWVTEKVKGRELTTCRFWKVFVPSCEDFAGPGLGSATFDGEITRDSTWARTGGGDGCLIFKWAKSSWTTLAAKVSDSSTGIEDHLPSSRERTDSRS